MPLAEAIKRRLFNRRYAYVGRAMLAELAAIYGISIGTAAAWADDCDGQEGADLLSDGLTGDPIPQNHSRAA